MLEVDEATDNWALIGLNIDQTVNQGFQVSCTHYFFEVVFGDFAIEFSGKTGDYFVFFYSGH